MTRPALLDLYCCAGGATRGYQEAGFEVTGVDIAPQPDYVGDAFHQADAITFVLDNLEEIRSRFDFVHASPPCQGEGAPAKGTNKTRGKTHPHLIAPTRAALERLGLPYVIENVAGANLRKDLMLCGEMFGIGVLMHRYFEFGGIAIPRPVHPRHRGRVRGWRHGRYFDGPYVAAYGEGGGKATVSEMQDAKAIDWTTDHLALREAIPPAYTRHIGDHLITVLTGNGLPVQLELPDLTTIGPAA
ncbi:site-specific DNA-cytosine methylase [Nonomuraea polychroma]|uniref:Site-specific DNA-cytosine methylase n=1 Tax=Nonomuraea polychroma TaxID=46176 RepID=A0A438MHV5_9ACTN|nr:DNA cytosine methyltransferase [Nonomuraea polychroma]RVX45450.1 site-specific DNA-cytosine methylase [Nonomuraea polychroma]